MLILKFKVENADKYVAAVYNNTLYDFVSKNRMKPKRRLKNTFQTSSCLRILFYALALKDAKLWLSQVV